MTVQKKNGMSYLKIRPTVSQSVQKQGSYLHARNSPHYHRVHTPGNLDTCHISLVSTAVGLIQPKCEMC